MRVRYSIHHAREPLVVQRGTTALHLIPITTTLLSINYVINLCIRHCVAKRIENNAVFIFLRCQNESKTTVKENKLQSFCFKELQDGTGIDYACSSWKLLSIKVGLSPFLLMDLYLILHYYSCTATTLYCHFRNIEIESNDGSHLESLDALGPGRRIFTKSALAR